MTRHDASVRRRALVLGVSALLLSGVAACGGEEPAQSTVAGVPDASATATSLPDRSTVVSFTWAPVVVEDIPPAERQDLELMAEEFGIPAAEFIADSGNEGQIAAFIDRIRSAFPKDYSAGRLDGNGGRIWFTGTPPPEALQLIEEAAEKVSVAAGPERLFTDRELSHAMPVVYDVARELLPDGVSGGSPEHTEGVVVQVFDLGGRTVEELEAEIQADPRVQPLGIPVVIDFDPRYRMGGGDDG